MNRSRIIEIREILHAMLVRVGKLTGDDAKDMDSLQILYSQANIYLLSVQRVWNDAVYRPEDKHACVSTELGAGCIICNAPPKDTF